MVAVVAIPPRDELNEIAGRIARLGWHVVIYFDAVNLPQVWDLFTLLLTTDCAASIPFYEPVGLEFLAGISTTSES